MKRIRMLHFLFDNAFLNSTEQSIIALEQEHLHTAEYLAGSKNFKIAKKILLDLPIARRKMYLDCLRAAFSPAEAEEITNKIFIECQTSPYSAYEIFYAAHHMGTLKNFLKK